MNTTMLGDQALPLSADSVGDTSFDSRWRKAFFQALQFCTTTDSSLDTEFINWLRSAVENNLLRPYLTLQIPQHDASHWHEVDEFLGSESGQDKDDTVYMVTALDGALEFAQAAYFNHRNNGKKPEDVIERKDRRFYDRASYIADSFGGDVFPTPVVNEQRPHQARQFQDACIAVFRGSSAGINAASAAIELGRELAEWNEESGLSWKEHSHARTAIAPKLFSAIQLLPLVRRSQVLIDPHVTSLMSDEECQLIRAAGFLEAVRSEVDTVASIIRAAVSTA